jgi:hypothetical protein
MRTTSWATGLLAAFLAFTGAAGCATSSAPGPGAGAPASGYTDRGAVSHLAGTVPDVAERAEKVLRSQGITIATSMAGGAGYSRVLEGVKGGATVRITMTREAPDVTRVEVLAQKKPTEWDKGYANKLLQDIARA